MEFIAATNNEGKMQEIRRILEKMGHTVQSQREAGIALEPEETGESFAENAQIKARAICAYSKKPTLADDSGLCVDALHGAPGVHSARYCGRHGDDEANNHKLLAALGDLPKERRAAKFVSCVCVALPDGQCFTFTGECHGWVGTVRQGTNGFGYDPIFNVAQYNDRSYAQLTSQEKDAISHRGKAMAEMEASLPKLLGGEIL